MSIEKLKQDTYQFNSIAGTDKEVSYAAFCNQLDFLLEEVKEIEEALFKDDVEEVADGVVDAIIVALGMWQKLENMGVDMNKAADLIAQNNLSKYPSIHSETITKQTVEMYAKKGIEVLVETNVEGHCWVFRNKETGKILKPYGFKAVDLSDCIPEGVKIV